MKTLLSIILFVSLKSFAQTDSVLIHGYIKDYISKEPIYTIINLDTTVFEGYKGKHTTISDFDGHFKLKIPKSYLSTHNNKIYFYSYDYTFPVIEINSNQTDIILLGVSKFIKERDPNTVSEQEPLKNPKKDSCEILIATWFQPACRVDTCTNTIWHVVYNDKYLTKVLYKIYNTTKTKVIYKSNKIWEGKIGKPFPLEYHKAGYYPYEITFYTNSKKTIVKKGKVYLHIW